MTTVGGGVPIGTAVSVFGDVIKIIDGLGIPKIRPVIVRTFADYDDIQRRHAWSNEVTRDKLVEPLRQLARDVDMMDRLGKLQKIRLSIGRWQTDIKTNGELITVLDEILDHFERGTLTHEFRDRMSKVFKAKLIERDIPPRLQRPVPRAA